MTTKPHGHVANLSDFIGSLRALYQRGGQPRKAAEKVQALLGRVNMGEANPFEGLAVTNHGESRIRHVVKYDLGFSAHRLVTIQHDGLIVLAFTGDHSDTERWLDANRGLTVVRKSDGALEWVRSSVGNAVPPASVPSDLSRGKLLMRLPDDAVDYLLEGMARLAMHEAEDLESVSDDATIQAVCEKQTDSSRANALLDVLLLLRGGAVEEAVRRVQVLRGALIPLEEVPNLPMVEIRDGETVRLVPMGSPEYAKWFDWFVTTADYRSWMLFLHPDQKEWVERDFAGPASLTGVSGSGKTAIVVMRAIRLARQASPMRPVFVVTLNRSLALLIKDLIDHACLPEFRDRIIVSSFFEYAQRRLLEFEPENRKSYLEVTWKGEEHIDEVWREFYRCQLSDRSAAVLDPVHRTLVARSINAEGYIQEEFDWLRSGFGQRGEEEYLTTDRGGRAVPLDAAARTAICDGLAAWQAKMRFVGVIDHLGLVSALSRHAEQLSPAFSYVIVDEAQDFGTLEFSLIRRLVSEGPNDIFLCGDPVQRVHAKHRSLRQARLDVPPARSFFLRRNYRNTREILSLADRVLVDAVAQCKHRDPDFIRIEPELAYRSGSVPLLLTARSLSEEISCALRFAEETEATETKRLCIALAGFSLREVQNFARRVSLPALDGTIGLASGKVFLSDLEQTKGYEFDTICVLNCAKGIIPDPNLPEEEQLHQASRLYVAMTRAKRELILSCSGTPSAWLADVLDPLQINAWTDHVDITELPDVGFPEHLPELPEATSETGALTGREFLYTPYALGMTAERQDRLDRLVSGTSLLRDGRPVSWRNLSAAMNALDSQPAARRAFGEDSWKYFQSLFEMAGVRPL